MRKSPSLSLLLFFLSPLKGWTKTLTGMDNAQQQEEIDKNRAIFQNSAAPSVAPSSSPSEAPSQTLPCVELTSNARRSYTAKAAPCLVQFHTSHQEEMAYIEFKTSDLCTEDNAFLTVKEYIIEWPDECVRDFRRCYSTEHHKEILSHTDWQIPEEATHISVNCTENKMVMERVYGHKPTPQQELWKNYEWKFYNGALFLGFCVVGMYAVSLLIIQPIMNSLQRGPYHSNPDQHMGPEVEARNLMLDSETIDHHHPDDQFHLQIPADFDAVPIVPATALPEDLVQAAVLTEDLS